MFRKVFARVARGGGQAPVLLAVFALSACSKTIAVDLQVVEPCDQKNQALNGVSSFVLSTSNTDGTTDGNDSVAFSVAEGPQPIAVSLGEQIVTLQGFEGNVSADGAASATPQAVGRTMPLLVTEATPDLSSLVVAGKLDSFGRTTNAAAECTKLTPDAPVPGRHGHTATFVPVLNQVLIFGGAVWVEGEERLLPTAELWDPATGAITAVEGVGVARAYHAASALPDGRVLISGGFGVVNSTLTTLQTALIFDPVTLELETIQLRQPRAHHTSTLMEGAGLVVLAGGCAGIGPAEGCTPSTAGLGSNGASTNLLVNIETFDVAQGTSTVPVTNGLLTPRAFHQATSLENGQSTVLVVTGGTNAAGPVCDVEVFRADGGVLTNITTAAPLAGFPAGKCPVRHAAVALDEQRLVVIGGTVDAPNGAPASIGSAEVYLFTTLGGVSNAPLLTLLGGAGRVGHVAARLRDSSIVVIGGQTAQGAAAAEVIAPQPGTGTLQARPLANPPTGFARERAALAILPTNQLLLTGGHSTTPPFATTDAAEIYFGP